MGKLANDDLKAVIEKGLVQYSRENRELDILIFKEVSCTVLYICINVNIIVLGCFLFFREDWCFA